MATIRLLDGANDPYNGFIELERGDSIALSSSQGFILLTLDDIDETVIPTAQLTPDEAEILATKLRDAAREARELFEREHS